MDSDMLSSIFSDPEALQNAMKLASSFLGGGGAPPSAPPDAAPPPTPQATEQASTPQPTPPVRRTDYDPSAELIQRAMPVISSIMQSGQTAFRGEKRALLNAVKPFVTDQVAAQFDHAMRLVSMARMARSALDQFGQRPRTDGSREL